MKKLARGSLLFVGDSVLRQFAQAFLCSLRSRLLGTRMAVPSMPSTSKTVTPYAQTSEAGECFWVASVSGEVQRMGTAPSLDML